MFFLLKCAFWLALVYAAMLYGYGPVRPVASSNETSSHTAETPSRTGETVVRDAIGVAASGIVTMCARRPTDCVADAARLKALFEASGTVEPVVIGQSPSKARHAERRSLPSEPVATMPVDVPMPVIDPRRQRGFRG